MYEKGSRYLADWYDRKGKRKRKSFETAEAARNYEEQQKEAVRSLKRRPEYDFSGGVRGKYAARHAVGTNLVGLEPDVYAVFPDSGSVNSALRLLIEVAKRAQDLPKGIRDTGVVS